jgi:ankyrin repeat protein
MTDYPTYLTGLALDTLSDAVDRGDAAAVYRLLRDGADCNNEAGGDNTPLCRACTHGNLEILAMLIASGSIPDEMKRVVEMPPVL